MSLAPLPITKETPQETIEAIIYPESDGEPMANNTEQFDWIVTIKENLEILYEHNPNIFIAGDLFWYPVEGNNQVRNAPDVLVALGRPKGRRGSYLQWKEGNLPPQVVFEILSPGNRKQEMDDKFLFYERYGAEEYYLYDPDRGQLQGWLRNARGQLREIVQMQGWRSPWLGIRFELDTEGQLHLYNPDGSHFLTFVELNRRRQQAEADAYRQAALALAEAEARLQAETRAQAETEARFQAETRAQAETEARLQAETRAQAETEARLQAEAKVRELEEKLRQAGLL
jgi:Uma2 family endonuclease